MKKQIVTVLGAGNMGTAVAQVLAENGHEVRIWNWEGDHVPLQQIKKYRENKNFLPGVKLSKNIIPEENIKKALADAMAVFLVIPSSVMEHTISFAARSIPKNTILVDMSKGVCPKTLRLIPNVIKNHVAPNLKKRILTISGPAVANQMVKKHFTAMNIAGNKTLSKKIINLMNNDYIRLVYINDMIGVEVAGSFKNVYTIAIGICDGLDFGLNTKAALLTKALSEITDLTVAMGGKKNTVYNLAGVGDLIGTSLSFESRNRQFGELLGKGLSGDRAIKKIKQTVEGYEASRCLFQLAKKYKINMPFADLIYKCTKMKDDPRDFFAKGLRKIKFDI